MKSLGELLSILIVIILISLAFDYTGTTEEIRTLINDLTPKKEEITPCN